MRSAANTGWTRRERKLLRSFRGPNDVQRFLNRLRYNDRPETKSPRRVIAERTAHCFEGALFAAAVLRFQGYPPLLVDLAARNDDDHVIAVFRRDGLWGAVAKSNTTLLRYREPVYRSLRELVLSYFEGYFNVRGEKSLVSYSRPLNLSRFDRRGWMFADDDLDDIGDRLTAVPHVAVAPPAVRKRLSPADPDVVRACFFGALPSGLYRPR